MKINIIFHKKLLIKFYSRIKARDECYSEMSVNKIFCSLCDANIVLKYMLLCRLLR